MTQRERHSQRMARRNGAFKRRILQAAARNRRRAAACGVPVSHRETDAEWAFLYGGTGARLRDFVVRVVASSPKMKRAAFGTPLILSPLEPKP